ncbi:MAG: endonuclease MutS2 [Ruminiclostridium sp.]|nr:endonuclease MutS2 [Ruminiclostridium sp.]
MKKEYKKLELDKVLILLSEQAYCDVCREEILKITPSFDIDTVKSEIAKTGDAFTLSSKFGTPRFFNIKDVCFSAKRAAQGSTLSLRELLDIGLVLREVSGLVSWYSQCSGIESSLSEYFDILQENKHLEQTISNSIVSEEEISDSASLELARIRRAIHKKSLNIREQLDKLIKNKTNQKYLQESLVTMRDGRFVVPVKTEYKSEISGLVHDSSQTGATIFIEPMSVVEANNEIRVLQSREQEEIERIIKEMSEMVGNFSESLIKDYKTVLKLEIYFAKANLGARMKAVIPEISENPCFTLNKARHPLIDKDKVVPITLELGNSYSSLIVTGPNTGGKTVSLKTAGLLVLMAMCGMMIPASDNSVIGMFDEVYVDIGDEQSIEQSLSTFSSHMTNIVKILKTANESSLVLLDELCSGTDPVEGSALAVSILKELKSRECKLLATTHYQEVKMYAIETEGVENASCEFDVKTLQPTYRFIVGMPGKSNAFAISSKLGIDEYIIEEAKQLVSTENKRFEEIVEALEKSRQELEKLKSAVKAEERKSKELTSQLEEQRERLEREKEKELQAVRNKAMSIIEEVRFQGDLLLEDLEQIRKQKESADFSQKVKGARSRINSAMNSMYDTANPISEKKIEHYVLPRPLKVGDTVLVVDLNQEGTLTRLPDAKNICFVQIGSMKSKTKMENLRLIEKKESKKQTTPKVTKKTESNFTRKSGMELDIRGMMGDEGVMEVDRFIDSCLMSGISVITIIHGKGTGTLRSAVQQFLRRNPHVKTFRDGTYGEGDMGVTVAELG